MQANKSSDNSGFLVKCSKRQRLVAAVIFLLMAGVFIFLWFSAKGKINLGYYLNPCGIKQNYGFPCPTCGITTSALAFAEGRIFEAFYIQPAGAFLSCCLVLAAFLSLFTAVFGVYFRFLKDLAGLKIRYWFLIFFVIITAGWTVTLVRALAEKG